MEKHLTLYLDSWFQHDSVLLAKVTINGNAIVITSQVAFKEDLANIFAELLRHCLTPKRVYRVRNMTIKSDGNAYSALSPASSSRLWL